jgi:hypothetical protein
VVSSFFYQTFQPFTICVEFFLSVCCPLSTVQLYCSYVTVRERRWPHLFPVHALFRQIFVLGLCATCITTMRVAELLVPQQPHPSSAPYILAPSTATSALGRPAHASEANTSAPSSVTSAPRIMAPSKGFQKRE